MPVILTVTWEEKAFQSEFELGRRFKSIFPEVDANQWLTAEFVQPLKLDSGDEVKYLHFVDFLFFGSGFNIYLPEVKVIYFSTDTQAIGIKISSLRPVPVNNFLNRGLNSNQEPLYAHVYFYPPDENAPLSVNHALFMKTVQSSWNGMAAQINSLLLEHEKGTYGQVVGIISEIDKVPRFYPVSKFFIEEFLISFGRTILTMFISSFQDFALRYGDTVVSSKNVPLIPKLLILLKADMYPSDHSYEIDPPSRRLFRCLFNGGIPVSMFDKNRNVLIRQGSTFSTNDFERTCLKLSNGPEPIDYESILGHSIDLLKRDIFNDSSEATWRSLVWDRIIADLFLYGTEPGDRRNFNLVSEWQTMELFPKLESRRVDFIASIKPNQTDFPIFLVEIGTKPFSTTVPHKDYSKLLCQMSLMCNRLAYDLGQNGKSPLNARVYGLWIGDGTVQFVVAHPVLTERDNGLFEVHTHLAYEDHWLFHLFSESNINPPCNQPCCCDDGSEPTESIVPGNTSDFRSFLSAQPRITRDIGFDEESEGPFLRVQESEPLTSAEPHGTTYSNFLNLNLFKKLHAFIKIVRNRINLIMSEEASSVPRTRLLHSSDYGHQSRSRTSSGTDNTPGRVSFGLPHARTANTGRSPSKKQRRTATKNGTRRAEFIAASRLSSMSRIFPRLIDYECRSDDGLYDIEFEDLLPLTDDDDFITDLLNRPTASETLLASLVFGVETLYGLYLLHNVAGMVHSDISDNNVMFSEEDDCWKLNDVGQSLPIQESLLTRRAVGTEGYLCPESRITGIFTQASDIYALGQLFIDVPLTLLISQILMLEPGDDDYSSSLNDRPAVHKFNNLASRMSSNNPINRPTTHEALIELFSVLELYEYDRLNPVLSAVRILLKQEHEESMLQMEEIQIIPEIEVVIENIPRYWKR